MKRTTLIFLTLILALPVFAQERKEGAYDRSQLESRVFEITNRDPRAIASSIMLLGTAGHGADLSVNPELNTITVRDFPEKLAAIEAAIRRLDVPSPASRGIELQLYVLVGAGEPNGSKDLPADLERVVRELKAALRYSSYSLMTSALHQTRAGHGIEGSGVADATLVNFETPGNAPLVYSYSLREIELRSGSDGTAVDVQNFRFTMKMPVAGTDLTYIDVGFDTPVMIREGEKVVVGTTAMGDKALVVVVTAEVMDPES